MTEIDSSAPTPQIRIRIESLSDLVFGLALSIGSLVLIGKVPQSGHSLVHPVVIKRFRAIMKAEIVGGLIFVVSALPVFWVNTPVGFLRFILWYSAFVIFGFTRFYSRSENE